MRPSTLETIFALSPMQMGVLFHALYDPARSVYVNQSVFTVSGDLDVRALRLAFERLVDRHQVLRASFFWEGLQEPVQAIHRHAPLPFEYRDMSNLSSPARRIALEQLLDAQRSTLFDLRRPPQMRVCVVRDDPASHRIVWSRHHILSDGWSQGLLLGELFLLYEAFRFGPDVAFDESALVGPRVPFEGYVRWLREHAPPHSASFWREHLAGVRAPTPLGDSQRPQRREGATQREIVRELPSGLAAALERAARAAGVTISAVYQAAWGVLLAHVSGCRDVVYGLTVSGRPAGLAGIERAVGLFINTVPVRAAIDPEATFAALAAVLQDQVARLTEHQHTPLVEIQRASDVPPGTALFHSIVVIGNYPTEFRLGEPRCSVRVTGVHGSVQNSLPLTLRIMPGTPTRVGLLYDDSALGAAAVDEIAARFHRLLEAIAGGPAQRVSSFLAELRDLGERRAESAIQMDTRRLAELRWRSGSGAR